MSETKVRVSAYSVYFYLSHCIFDFFTEYRIKRNLVSVRFRAFEDKNTDRLLFDTIFFFDEYASGGGDVRNEIGGGFRL